MYFNYIELCWMFNLKKIVIYSFVTSVFVSTIFLLFVNADEYDVSANDFSQTKNDVDIVKKIEISSYYGVSSLLINLHLEIGKMSDDEQVFYGVELLNELKYYADLDVITSLAYTFDLQYSLDKILLDLSNMLDDTVLAKRELENNMLKLKQDKFMCDENKEISDKNFTLALKDFDSKNMKIYLDESLDYDSCAGESRIYYNVQNKILQQVDFYYEILKTKYSYFSSNRDDIIFNYPKILYNLSKK